MTDTTQPDSTIDGDEIHDIRKRMRAIEAKIDENTALTEDIRDALRAATWVVKFVKLIGALSIAGSAIYAGWYQVTHGGKLPN